MSKKEPEEIKLDIEQLLKGVVSKDSTYKIIGGNKTGTSPRPARVPRPPQGGRE